ncbi:cytochrome P450 [Hyaloscypha variabilis]
MLALLALYFLCVLLVFLAPRNSKNGLIYGPFHGVKLMGKQRIFIGLEKTASELFGSRGSEYSGHPAVPTIIDSQSKYGTAEYMVLMSKNKYHTRQKKFNHIQLAAAQKLDYYNYPSIEARRFIWRMLNDCSDWVSLCEDMTSRTICRLTWGTPDHAIGLKADAWGLLNAISPVGNLTNLVTPLLWIPKHRVQQEWFKENMEGVRKKMAEGKAGPSFARNFIEESKLNPDEPFDFMEAASTLGTLSVAAVYTVSSPLQTFVRAAVLHPKWFRKVQDEIDLVCGQERMPEVSDSPLLPALRAFIKECLRWRPPIPTGVSHELEEDDVYEGCFVPKGTRGLSRDASVYHSPQIFNPERWLSPAFPTTYREPLTSYPTIQGFTTFGWGRRVYQGATLTQQELMTACGGLAWAFNISCPDGNLVIVKPEGFPIRCVVRGKRAEVIKRLYEESWKEDCLRKVGSVNVE